MFRITSGFLAFLVPMTMLADAPPDVRSTLTKAARFLQDDMQTWRTERNCGACHHAPLALWTLSELTLQKIEVDAGYIANLTEWVRTDDNVRLLPNEPAADTTEQPTFSLPAVYLSFGVNALAERTPDVQAMRQRLVRHLQMTQHDNGSWVGPVGRPPVFAPQVEATLLAMVAWQPQRDEFAELPAMLDQAAAWVAAQPVGESPQELALRLMWSAGQNDQAALTAQSQRLLSAQQPDGGWRQQADFPSDAFATGQALVALRSAGVPASDPAIQRGIQFLGRTQSADGSWPMKSRPHPENGSVARNLNPITYAGTAWAVAGLLACLPVK